ncbi:MAG: peptidase [Daejeonella sp.]|nr:peptidase [Daejeonella sp.]
MINRTQAPEFKQIEDIELIHAKSVVLDNGVKTYVISGGQQELVRIEFIFSNVSWDVTKPLQAYVTNSMLNDGTSEFNAAEIADKIDYYGAFLQTEYNYDQSTVTLFTLNKHVATTLPIVKSILSDSIFPQSELETLITNQKQKLSVNLEKNDFVSRRTFNKALFGNTLYGYDSDAINYDKLQREDILEYFKKAYQPKNCTIIISGKVTEDILKNLNDQFGNNWSNDISYSENIFNFDHQTPTDNYIAKADAIQSAIRVGGLAVNRNHPDFPGLQVVNTILGGYFGSRLMANIREDKGYTYGIGSALVSLKNAGYLFIATEVGAEVCGAAMVEIKKEIDTLKNEAATSDELNLVRNYMLGSMLGSLENALSHADKFKNIHFFNLGYDYYKNYIEVVRTITPQQVQELANKYLDYSHFDKVIVGKK